MSQTRTEGVFKRLERMPRDRGWAWIILIAAWLNHVIQSVIYKSFGIIYIAIQTKYGSNSAKTSLIYSLIYALFSITTLLIAILDVSRISARQFIYVGSVLTSLGYLAAAFATDVDLLIAALGIGLGIGQGCVWTQQTALIGQYFDKKKGLVNSMVLTGGSVGAIVIPYVIGDWMDNYGLTGTFMLIGAFSLNGLVNASLMRPFPLEEYNILTALAAEIGNSRDIVDASESDKDTDSMLNGTTGTKESNQDKEIARVTFRQKGDESLAYDANSSSGTITHTSNHTDVELSIPSIEGKSIFQISETMEKESSSYFTAWATTKSKLKSVLDLNLFKIPIFLFYIPFAVLMGSASTMYQAYILPYAKDSGLSEFERNTLITVSSITDILSIPLWGLLADRRFIPTNKLVAIAMVCLGASACSMSLARSYGTLLVLSALFGVFGRVYHCLYPVILIEFLGLEYLKSSVGITLVLHSVIHSIMHPVVGMMRDTYGTYVHSYEMMGAFLLVGSAGILVMPPLAVKIYGLPQKKRIIKEGN